MSRSGDLMTRLERVAKTLGMELEECLAVLEGKHRTHCVSTKEPLPNPTPVIPSEVGSTVGGTEGENPTSSGDAAASAAQQNQAAAASTVSDGSNVD